MRNNLPNVRGFRALALILFACFVALSFVRVTAARQGDNNNSNAAQSNVNNSNGASATQENKNAAQGNKNGGDVQKTGVTPSPSPAPTAGPTPDLSFAKRPCGSPAEPAPAGAKVDLQSLRVVAVMRIDGGEIEANKSAVEREADKRTPDVSAGLYNTICVRVQNLAAWLEDPTHDPNKLFLYLNTYPLTKVTARPVGSGSDDLRFDLLPMEDKDTRENWRRVLSRPALLPPETRPVMVSLGYQDDPGKLPLPIKSNVTGFPLVVVNAFWFVVFAFSVAAAFVFFGWLVIKSDLLRDDVPEPVGLDRKGKPNRKPFSLGRSQMAFWFFIVITCYVFIWMVTSNGNTITNTVLGLIGISAATALGSVLITNGKSDNTDERRAELDAERQRLVTRIEELSGGATPGAPGAAAPALSAAEQKELNARRSRLQDVDQLLAGASRGFFTDILSDAGGVSFHRFQIVAWTVALGVIFIGQVFNYLLMPDFDSTLLALMGISSGTYLGFKFPEKQA
jgi:hypothetical protein